MSYEALMRWEWEGGTPASSASEPAQAEDTEVRPRPADRRRLARRGASLSTLSGRRRGDGRER
jgi:hypothetical protein